MTVRGWWNDQHVLIAACRAANDNAAAVAASPSWAGALYLPPLPTAGTTYDDEGVPLNCGYAIRELSGSSTNRKVPYCEVYTSQGATGVGWTDTEAQIMRVTLNVRVRCGYTGGINGANTSQQRALALCRLMQVTIGRYLLPTARALDPEPDSSFGICWSQFLSSPTIDLAPPAQSTAAGNATIDAVCTISVQQRQYMPAGYSAP